ncbi:hypothetical protein ACOSQ2_025954 [Xanthoceras sorbifolium]
MALVPDQKLRKTFSIERSPLMLKDYLRDDLSSCSSNGFKSFPRRQCCTTVRFLLEIDLKTRDSNTTTTTTKRLLHRSRSKAASTTISALQRASEAVLSAVKLLPFPNSVKSQSPSPSVQRRAKKGLLSRSFSRKLLKRSFWKKADRRKEDEEHTRTIIKPLKLFGEFLGEQHQPSDQNNPQFHTTSSTPNRVSISCSSSKSNSNSWTESDFTENTLQSSSGNSESSSENDAVESPNDVQSSVAVSNQTGVSVGEDSINCSEENTTKDWRNEEEKEQCSPVSVLDCPFEDDETDITSPFHQRLAHMEGTKQKLMQKLRRFESLARLEPVDLEKRITSSEFDDDDSAETPVQFNKENETEKRAEWLVKEIKSTTPSNNILLSKSDNLLSDFFREMIEDQNQNDKNLNKRSDTDMLKAAQDWIYRKSEETFVGWEVEGGREGYLRDIETNGRWKNNVNEEKQELGLALEVEVFASLVNELVIDLF